MQLDRHDIFQIVVIFVMMQFFFELNVSVGYGIFQDAHRGDLPAIAGVSLYVATITTLLLGVQKVTRGFLHGSTESRENNTHSAGNTLVITGFVFMAFVLITRMYGL